MAEAAHLLVAARPVVLPPLSLPPAAAAAEARRGRFVPVAPELPPTRPPPDRVRIQQPPLTDRPRLAQPWVPPQRNKGSRSARTANEEVPVGELCSKERRAHPRPSYKHLRPPRRRPQVVKHSQTRISLVKHCRSSLDSGNPNVAVLEDAGASSASGDDEESPRAQLPATRSQDFMSALDSAFGKRQSTKQVQQDEEDLSHLGRGRSAVWQMSYPSWRHACPRTDPVLRPLPTDFGTSAQKEQVKMCDSIRSNIVALGEQRNELRELRQNMHQLLKSGPAPGQS